MSWDQMVAKQIDCICGHEADLHAWDGSHPCFSIGKSICSCSYFVATASVQTIGEILHLAKWKGWPVRDE